MAPKGSIPQFTLQDYADCAGLKRRFGQVRLGWEVGKLFWHLPGISKKRILKYLCSPSLIKDLLNRKAKGLVTRKVVCYAGVPFSKFAQGVAQRAGNAADLRLRIKTLTNQTESLERQIKKLGKGRVPAPLLSQRSDLRRQLMNAKVNRWARTVFGPMLDNAPPIPQKELQPDLDKLVELVNQHQPKGHRLLASSLGKRNKNLIGAASVAQVYRGDMADGRQVVLKVMRPDANQKYIAQFERLVARFGMLLLGTAGDMQSVAVRFANNSSDILRQEISPKVEAESAKRLRRVIKARNIGLHIPEIYAYSDRGLVEEFVDGETFNNRSLPPDVLERALKSAKQELMRLMLTNPALHADITSGNMMVEWNEAHEIERLSLIDFGRSAVLEPESFALTTDLMQAVLLKKPKEEQLALLDRFFEKPEAVPAERKAEILDSIGQKPLHTLGIILNKSGAFFALRQKGKQRGAPIPLRVLKGFNAQPGAIGQAFRKYNEFNTASVVLTDAEKKALSLKMADDILFYSNQAKGRPANSPMNASQKLSLAAAIEQAF